MLIVVGGIPLTASLRRLLRMAIYLFLSEYLTRIFSSTRTSPLHTLWVKPSLKRGILNMIFPHTELRYIDEQIGYGVFATKFIPKGTITWALDDLDQIIDPEFVASVDQARSELIRKYSYRNQDGKYILCWDLGRFVNHSFHANCIGTAYEFEIAIRDIYPGEQLTDDYGSLNIDEPFQCVPEAGTNRKWVYPDDLLNYHQEWDQKVLSALKYFNDVEQPLIHLVRSEFMDKIKLAIEQEVLPNSIKEIYYDRHKMNK
jgi:uncharacterized protein